MIRAFILAAVLWFLPIQAWAQACTTSNVAVGGTATCTSVSIRAVTWTFASAETAGRFTTGDWWVTTAISVTAISPAPTTIGGYAVNGSMVNPSLQYSSQHGYDGRPVCTDTGISCTTGSAQGYQAGLNVALSLPLAVATGSSLLSSEGYTTDTNDGGVHGRPGSSNVVPWIRSIEILTVLASAPASDAFRPPYAGTNKTISSNWRFSSVNFGLLNNANPLASTNAIGNVTGWIPGPMVITRTDGINGRETMPYANWATSPGVVDTFTTYGQGIGRKLGTFAVQINLNRTTAEKTEIVKKMVQGGIDLYGIINQFSPGAGVQSTVWTPNGGHNHGWKMPVFVAGVLLNDSAIKAKLNGQATTKIFAEDQMYHYVAQSDISTTQNSNCVPPSLVQYTQAELGIPEWSCYSSFGTSGTNRVYNNGNALWINANGNIARYRDIAIIAEIASHLAVTLMGQKALWNVPAAFDYFETRVIVSPFGGSNPTPTQDVDLYTAYKNIAPPSGVIPPADALPTITISTPSGTSSDVAFAVTTADFAGVAADDNALAGGSVTWSNALTGGSGAATGTTSWTKSGVSLSVGSNYICFVVTDTLFQTATDCFTVTRAADVVDPPGGGTALDTFDRTDSLSIGSNWTCPSTLQLGIFGNAAVATSSAGRHFCWYNAMAFANNQWAAATIGATPSGAIISAVGVRWSGTANSGASGYNGYSCTAEAGGLTVPTKFILGVRTGLVGTAWSLPGGAVWVAGDSIRADITGDTLTCLRNGVSIGNIATGGQLTSGEPMVGAYGGGSLTEFAAGDDGTAGDSTRPVLAFTTPGGSITVGATPYTAATGAFSDAVGVATCTWLLDETPAENGSCGGTALPATSGTWTIASIDLTEITQTLRVRATDAAGNYTEVTRPITYIAGGPAATFTTPTSADTFVQRGPNAVLGGTFTAAACDYLKITNTTSGEIAPYIETGVDTWEARIALVGGANTITVRCYEDNATPADDDDDTLLTTVAKVITSTPLRKRR